MLGGAPSSLHGVPFNRKRTALMLASSGRGGSNRSMLEHVSFRLKTARAWRGPTLAHALIRFGRNALYNDDQDFCYTIRAVVPRRPVLKGSQ